MRENTPRRHRALALAAAALVLPVTGATAGTASADVVATIASESVTVDDAATGAPGFGWYGTWGTSTGASKSLGRDHYSSTRGAATTLTFSGTAVQLVGALAPHHGKALVSVDGGRGVTVDQYARTRTDAGVFFSTSGLKAGTHTVKVTVLGTKQTASQGTVVAVDHAVVTTAGGAAPATSAPAPAPAPAPASAPAPAPAPASTGRVVLAETGDGADARPYASTATNGSHGLWHVESGSAALDRAGGKLVKKSTGQFHRAFSQKRMGGPGKTLTISYRGRATDIRNRAGSSITEGAKIGLKFPTSSTGYSKDDPRSVYGKSGSSASPGSYQFLTGLTENGHMELSRNPYGTGAYKFWPSKKVGYTEGSWKDVTIKVEWVSSSTMRVRYWHNADASGAPVYEATDSGSPFAGDSAFLWLRTDDADWEYDHITVTES